MEVTVRAGALFKRIRIRHGGLSAAETLERNTALNEALKAAIWALIKDEVVDLTLEKAQRLRRAMEGAANRELLRLIPFMTRHLMGRQSPGYGALVVRLDAAAEDTRMLATVRWPAARQPPAVSLVWRYLSHRTVAIKGHRRFFEDTLTLKRHLEQANARIAARMGGVKVTLNEAALKALLKRATLPTRREVISLFTIHIVPNVRPSALPMLQTGVAADADPRSRLEFQFVGGMSAQKLAGPSKRWGSPNAGSYKSYFYRQRPMLAPALSFWIRYRIPRALALAANNSLKSVGALS